MAKRSMHVGDIFINNQGCSLSVVDYKNAHKVKVRFSDSNAFEVVTSAGNIRRGLVKNPYHPVVYGVGFIGVGEHKAKHQGRCNPTYTTWIGMFIRCYRENVKQADSSYTDCHVSPEWHNFQNFAEWHESQEYKGLGYHLDKDLLKKGNRVYSAELCCLIPVELNAMIVNPAPSKSGLPVGVNKDKKKGEFRARLSKNGVAVLLGVFSTIEEARGVYVAAKEDYVKSMANEWRERISYPAYKALINWSALND